MVFLGDDILAYRAGLSVVGSGWAGSDGSDGVVVLGVGGARGGS